MGMAILVCSDVIVALLKINEGQEILGLGLLYFCPVVSSIYLSSSFFPRLISAVVDRMSTILHMV